MSIDINKLDPISRVENKVQNGSHGQHDSQASRKSGHPAASQAPASMPGDVNLSTEAQALTAGTAPTDGGIDKAKVDSIRSAIEEGRYHVDPVRLAKNFLDLEQQLS